jgi:hypothetical protein
MPHLLCDIPHFSFGVHRITGSFPHAFWGLNLGTLFDYALSTVI